MEWRGVKMEYQQSLERRLDIMERLLKFWVTVKETGAIEESKRLAVYSALGQLTTETMRTYPQWFEKQKPYPTDTSLDHDGWDSRPDLTN